MSVTDEKFPTAAEVIDGLSEHVWQLLRAGHVDAAMVLLRGSLDDFMAAREREAKAVVKWVPPAGSVRRRPIPMPAPSSAAPIELFHPAALEIEAARC